MNLIIKKSLTVVGLLVIQQIAQAQSTITQWNFNSVPPDNNLSTGTTTPNIGSGTITGIGGVTTSFASGAANGGSSDPATADNSGWGLTNFPSATANNKTAGIQAQVSTVGFKDIIITFDQRHSNTGAANTMIQYCTNISAATPVWIDLDSTAVTSGDAWNNRSFNMTGINSINNNAQAAFRIVSKFANGTSSYAPSNPSSSYAATGTWRFDMLTIKGTSISAVPPVVTSHGVINNTTSYVKFDQALSNTSVIPGNFIFDPSLTVSSTQLLGANNDSVLITHSSIIDGQPYELVVKSVQSVLNVQMSANDTLDILWHGGLPNLVITEIIHSPNDIEMIEVYNAGATSVNLGGLKWTDGTTGSFPVIALAAGDNIVFATSPTTASTNLNVSPVYLINNGLGSSSDNLYIRNSKNELVDQVDYFVGTNGWPAAPSGTYYGYAIELTSATLDNNVGANWIAQTQTITPTPAVGTIRSTAGIYPPPVVNNTSISLVSNVVKANETDAFITIIATLNGDIDSTVTAKLVLDTVSSTASLIDVNIPGGGLEFSWVPNSNGINDTIQIPIINDIIEENTEYLVFQVQDVQHALPNNDIVTVFILDDDLKAPVASKGDFLKHITSYQNGTAGTESAEIISYDKGSKRLFIANSIGGKIDIVDFSNPANPQAISSIAINPTYGNLNSLTTYNGIVAAAIENLNPQDSGKVVFFDTSGAYLSEVQVGAMPDMITFNHDGTLVLTANEGEPNIDYSVDPEGSISIIEIGNDVKQVSQNDVSFVTFEHLNTAKDSLIAANIRIFGPNATVVQDLEPEYIAISADNKLAYITLQENNAIATIDLTTKTLTNLQSLGTKDHSLTENALDVNDQSGFIAIANWPVKGVYMPDAIASYQVNGVNYFITANEGDAREYDNYEEVVRMNSNSYQLDSTVFHNIPFLKQQLGRLNVTTASGDANKDGLFEEIHILGGRSFTIWNADSHQIVYDNGQDFELITSQSPLLKHIFNASNSNNNFKNRSDDKGPEPEGVTIAKINDRQYAFIGLERIGGCMVYDVTQPSAPFFVDYKNTRDTATYGGDQGAEGIIFIDSINSPNGKPYVLLANEVSSTVSVFEVQAPAKPPVSIDKIDGNDIGIIYPNPAQLKVYVTLNEKAENTKITLYDLTGKAIYQTNSHEQTSTIDIAQLSAGMYIIKVENKNVSGTFKFSKL